MAVISMMAKGQLVDWHCHNVMPDFVAALPLPDVDKSISEAEFAMTELGALGVKYESP